MPTDAYNNTSSEERRALLERRRAEVARQMRGLAKELAERARDWRRIQEQGAVLAEPVQSVLWLRLAA